ncbi:hypothetical protein M404DRAFT_647376 [Pisolithus tinctorius Marx 270]|uniref:Probable 26S proteasome regulatory subunit p27 n=1 Tax=Pisolithus tinctorius Marx 270 TaxID=870435 RepID=A0A0C3NPR0_PISTI|nr:hypothetical protein M404DRAFT_647376 [Pisolithus tinctorius Marx 270]
MGLMLPSPDSPRERARQLIAKKDAIEAEINAQADVLKANSSDMTTPLVDREGFPRADLDIYAIRRARHRIIELRNDLKDVTNEIGKVLEQVFDPSVAALVPSTSVSVEASSLPSNIEGDKPKPFARVDGVAPDSPAAESGLHREDLIVKFGHLTRSSFSSAASLQRLAELVSVSENRELVVQVFREEETLNLNLIPRKGWGGRGMLGCHIVPYNTA